MNDTKTKYEEFYKWVVNQGIEVSDKTNSYQCMDLAYAWCFYLNFPKSTIQHLYAYQVYTEPSGTTRQYFDLIPNTPDGVPQAGDLVVFKATTSNIAGHISVATGNGNTTSFVSLDQNWGGVGKATLTTHNYDLVIGWLRPHLIYPTPVITDQTVIDLSEYGKMEVQAIRGKLGDLKRAEMQIISLESALSECRATVPPVVLPNPEPTPEPDHSSSFLADLITSFIDWIKNAIKKG